MVQANTLTKEYGVLPSITLTEKLREQLKDLDIAIECFYRDPETHKSNMHDLAYLVDIVITAMNKKTWLYLYLLFDTMKPHCKRFDSSNEIIILAANTIGSELMTFINTLPSLRQTHTLEHCPMKPSQKPEEEQIISYFFQQPGRPKFEDVKNNPELLNSFGR